jgi:hypothetical protein
MPKKGEFTEQEAKEAGYSSAQEMNDERASQEASLGNPHIGDGDDEND